MARAAVAPAMLTAHHDCEFREVLDRVGDKWSLLVIAMLEQRPTARARFSELKRSIPGISQRMLTATLRSLERDGLLTRHVYAEVPPRVEYALTKIAVSGAGTGIDDPAIAILHMRQTGHHEVPGAHGPCSPHQVHVVLTPLL